MRKNRILTLIIITIGIVFGCQSPELWKNLDLKLEERVNDLVGRMTLDEKISQMMDVSAAIPRLGIPEYNWWNEGLHGVARADFATVFPQAIALAATFNDSLHFEIANVISDEFRAKYNYYQSIKDYGRYKGLTVWSPNINIFRDPRWGRGQETYGEDPYLTSRMGVAFVKGLQGNDLTYLKTVATPKHYMVHSGPEPLRHVFDANTSEFDFMDTYLPAFEACIKEGKAYSIMGAYNRFRGKSCSASDTLLTTILRKEWGFKGYVVSDCGAITDVFASHKIVETPAEAAALGVKSGCDLECGETYQYLHEAVDKGFITEAEIDVAVKRLYLARFKLGMFDPAEKVPYNKIPITVNDCGDHRKLALEASRQSIVLLKNDNLLPLSKSIKNVLVIGPNADDNEVLYGNYNGTPSKSTNVLQGIKNTLGDKANVIFQHGCNYVDSATIVDLVKDCFLNGLNAEFYNNNDLSGQPVVTEKHDFIKFSWPGSPAQGINNTNYSIRWTGELIAPASGNYQFSMSGDDGYRLFIDDKELLSDWTSHSTTTRTAAIQLEKGGKYKLKVEFFNGVYGAVVSLNWKVPGSNPGLKILESAKISDVIVFVGGLSPNLEGEEMNVPFEGFLGGDRVSIDLPAIQTQLLQLLAKTGKPIVLVLLNGSALAINWEVKNIPAIVEAWYPGQDGGQAIADVLFGDYNPSGKLPITFYKSVDQLPDFTDYNMNKRTYRYFKGEPLFPFGYGLSYTTFEFSNLNAPSQITTGENINVEVTIKNTGKTDGDEVVQLYLKAGKSDLKYPNISLQGFKRVHLKTGESKQVSFVLKPSNFSGISSNNIRMVTSGNFELFVGSQLPSGTRYNGLTKAIAVVGSDFIVE